MARKLYRVTMESEYIAFAEDEREAESLAYEARRDSDEWDTFASELTGSLPPEWTERSGVYNVDGDDITVAQARELMAPPEDAAPTAAELEAAGQMRLIEP